MFNFLKLFKRKRSTQADYKQLDKFLKTNQLLEKDKRPNFFIELRDSFFPELPEEEYPDYYQFKIDFDRIEEEQRGFFNALLNSDFNGDSVEKFNANYKNVLNYNFHLPSTSIFFISFWNQVMKKLNTEVLAGGHSANKQSFDSFFSGFEKMSKEEFDKKTRPENV